MCGPSWWWLKHLVHFVALVLVMSCALLPESYRQAPQFMRISARLGSVTRSRWCGCNAIFKKKRKPVAESMK